MENKRFLTAANMVRYMGAFAPMAYRIVHRLNDKLAASGYLAVSGRVSHMYFEMKNYGGV